MTLPPIELRDVVIAALITLFVIMINTMLTAFDFRQRYQYRIFVNEIYKTTLYSNHLFNIEKLERKMAAALACTPGYEEEPSIRISVKDRRTGQILS